MSGMTANCYKLNIGVSQSYNTSEYTDFSLTYVLTLTGHVSQFTGHCTAVACP
jgi:hypothetical protein